MHAAASSRDSKGNADMRPTTDDSTKDGGGTMTAGVGMWMPVTAMATAVDFSMFGIMSLETARQLYGLPGIIAR